MAVPMVLKNTNVRGATHEAPLTGKRAATTTRGERKMLVDRERARKQKTRWERIVVPLFTVPHRRSYDVYPKFASQLLICI